MKDIANTLAEKITEISTVLGQLDEQQWNVKSNPAKWSKKEIIGHLTDSAHNNLNRFIRAQYENTPHIVYDQDKWVTLQNYQALPSSTVLLQWKVLNQIIVNVLENMAIENGTKECDTGKAGKDLHSLKWLAEDYLQHLDHHMQQVLAPI